MKWVAAGYPFLVDEKGEVKYHKPDCAVKGSMDLNRKFLLTLLNAENWWEALAVCEYALDTHEDEALTAGFFELIFSAYDCNVEVDLNEEEYAYWWE
ncbi:hypothetical protein, partial [Bacteroides fragilis]|uniref:hypothetical protein n=1 Tax=Bacteroides fragilis TaxID=817 RepID=UPI001E4D96FC